MVDGNIACVTTRITRYLCSKLRTAVVLACATITTMAAWLLGRRTSRSSTPRRHSCTEVGGIASGATRFGNERPERPRRRLGPPSISWGWACSILEVRRPRLSIFTCDTVAWESSPKKRSCSGLDGFRRAQTAVTICHLHFALGSLHHEQ